MDVQDFAVAPLLGACLASGAFLGAEGAAPVPVLFRAGARSMALSPDGGTLWFPEGRSVLQLSRKGRGGWSRPETLPFSTDFRQGDPFFSPDGTQLFFWSTRPREGAPGKGGATDLWVVDRKGEGWGPPRCLGIAIHGKAGGSVFPSVDAAGNLTFCSSRESLGQRDLYVARREGQGYAAPENLGPPINSPGDEFDGTISPDGRTLVFCRGGGPSGSGLFLSRREGGAWAPPRNLGPLVNFGLCSYCPAWSPDGRWLHFTNMGGKGHAPGIYRIAAADLGLGPSGRARPCAKARLLAPGRISRHGAFGITFTPDGRTACFAETHQFIMETRRVDGVWTEPRALPFTAMGHSGAPALSPDGSTLFYASTQAAPGKPQRCEVDWGLWSARREARGWGRPRRLGNLLDEALDCFVDSPSVAADGTLFFTAIPEQPATNARIFSVPPGGTRGRALEGAFNAPDHDQAEVAVLKDGNTLVFSSNRPGGAGGYDLYRVRRQADGTWGPARNLGPGINTAGTEASPMVAGDGRSLFFYSDRDKAPGIYRVELPL